MQLLLPSTNVSTAHCNNIIQLQNARLNLVVAAARAYSAQAPNTSTQHRQRRRRKNITSRQITPCDTIEVPHHSSTAPVQAMLYLIPQGQEEAACRAFEQAGVKLMTPLAPYQTQTQDLQGAQVLDGKLKQAQQLDRRQQPGVADHARDAQQDRQPGLLQHSTVCTAGSSTGTSSTASGTNRKRRVRQLLQQSGMQHPSGHNATGSSSTAAAAEAHQKPPPAHQGKLHQQQQVPQQQQPQGQEAATSIAPRSSTMIATADADAAATGTAAGTDAPGSSIAASSHSQRHAVGTAGPGPDTDATAGTQPAPAWVAAVERRVAGKLPGTRLARHARWLRQPIVSSQSSGLLLNDTAAARMSGGKQLLAPLSLAAGSASSLLLQQQQPGGLTAEGEAQLCELYQRYLKLDALVHSEVMQQLVQLQQQPDAQQEQLAHIGSSRHKDLPHERDQQTQQHQEPAAFLGDTSSIRQEGLLAQELLLQLYEPMLLNRVKRAQQPGVDWRELHAAARQGLLRAAARFDPHRGAADSSRLSTLADMYIKNALRGVLREYHAAAVSVPVTVMELRAKLLKVQRQLQQQGRQPSLAEVASTAGVSKQQAERALKAAGTALQAASLGHTSRGDKHDPEAASTVDLQRLDLSVEEDSSELLGAVAAGGLAAARSGLQEELDAAAETAALEDMLQGIISKLDPRDRDLLAVRLQGEVSLSEHARRLGVSRQASHQMLDRVLKQLRRQVQQVAGQDTEVAALIGWR